MADHDWRALERRWQADPSDQDALQRAIAARRRAGVPVSGWMLDLCEFPARTFDSSLSLDVFVVTLEGRTQGVGRTPAGGEGLSLPAHRTWWVQPDPRLSLADVARLVHDEQIPGLSLAPQVRDDDLEHLVGTPLQRLDLGGCTRIGARGLAAVAQLTQLTHLNLWYSRSVDDAALRGLSAIEELATLNLSHCTKLTSLAPLAGLSQLSVLSCQGLPLLVDVALEPIRRLPRLAVLDLQRTGVGDPGLARLSDLPELTLLNVSFCPRITLEGLTRLEPCERLTHVFALGCDLNADAAAAVERTRFRGCELHV